MSRADFSDMTGAIYRAVSGPPGPRDYADIRGFYLPDARMIRTGIWPDGRSFMKSMSVDEHEADISSIMADAAFEEIELRHEAEIFGNVARAKSVYESRLTRNGETIVGRGVNFFNFVFDGRDWKIASIVWDNERDGLALSLD